MTRHRTPGSPLEEFRRYAESLADTVPTEEARRAVAEAMAGSVMQTVRWRHRLAAMAGALVMFAAANVGLAIASNGAVPGDELYFLKRAYERVRPVIGFEVDTRLERLEEAVVLAHRGRITSSLSLTEEALLDFEDVAAFQEAFRALRDAQREARFLEGMVGSVLSHDFRQGAQSVVTAAGSVVRAERQGVDPAPYLEHLYLTASTMADQAKELRARAADEMRPPSDQPPVADEEPSELGE